MVFDNSGNDGMYPEEGSRLMVFTIDETNMTAAVDWEYRHTNQQGELVYSQVVSDMDKSPFGSYTGVWGTKLPFSYVEVDEDKNVIFDMNLNLIKEGAEADADMGVPIACPVTRLFVNGVNIYRHDYESIYPSEFKSLD